MPPVQEAAPAAQSQWSSDQFILHNQPEDELKKGVSKKKGRWMFEETNKHLTNSFVSGVPRPESQAGKSFKM